MFRFRIKNEDTILHHLATKANAYLVTLASFNTLMTSIFRNNKCEASLSCVVSAENEKIVESASTTKPMQTL